MELINGKLRRTDKEKEQIRQKLLGRPSPNRGKLSPKKGLTEVQYYGEKKAQDLAIQRSIVHSGKQPWNKGKPWSDAVKQKISLANTSSWERDGVRYAHWLSLVFKTDNFTCQHCGVEVNLVGHHVKSWEEFKDLRFDAANGLTVCKCCHATLENTLKVLRRNLFCGDFIIVGTGSKVCMQCHRLIKPYSFVGIRGCSCAAN